MGFWHGADQRHLDCRVLIARSGLLYLRFGFTGAHSLPAGPCAPDGV
jgi:hypothetical protein